MLSFPVCLQLAMMNTVKDDDGEKLKANFPFKWKFNTTNFWTALRISENYHAVQTIPAKYGFFFFGDIKCVYRRYIVEYVAFSKIGS